MSRFGGGSGFSKSDASTFGYRRHAVCADRRRSHRACAFRDISYPYFRGLALLARQARSSPGDLMARSFALFAVAALAITCHAQEGQPHSGPSLKDTLQWMQDVFPESQTSTAERAGEKRELTSSECTITIHQDWTVKKEPVRRETIVDLSLIDPQSVHSYVDNFVSGEKIGLVMLTATNDKKVITETTQNRGTKTRIGKPLSSQHLWLYFIGPDYAERFAKAFARAVELCGGKLSTF
jgi:hypothetical protein